MTATIPRVRIRWARPSTTSRIRGASPVARVREEWPNPLSGWRFRVRLRLRSSNTLVRHLPMPGTSDGAAPSHACDRIDQNLPPDGVPFCDRNPLAVDKRCGRRIHPSDRFLDTTRVPDRCGGARCTGRTVCMFERIQRHRSLGRVGRHRRRGPDLPPPAGPQACRGARSPRRPRFCTTSRVPDRRDQLGSEVSAHATGTRRRSSPRWDEQRTECRIDPELRSRSVGCRERLVGLLPGQGPARH